MATPRKSTKSKTVKKPADGYVVEELGDGLVAVFPAVKGGDSDSYANLASELIVAADSPSEVQTRTMPKRFIVPARVAKAAGLI